MAEQSVALMERVRDQVRGVGFRVWGRRSGVAAKIPESCFAFVDWKEAVPCSSSVSQSSERP